MTRSAGPGAGRSVPLPSPAGLIVQDRAKVGVATALAAGARNRRVDAVGAPHYYYGK